MIGLICSKNHAKTIKRYKIIGNNKNPIKSLEFKVAEQLNISMDSELKHSVDLVLNKIGLSAPEAVRMFFRQMVALQRLPLSTSVVEIEVQSSSTRLNYEESQKFLHLLEHPEEFEQSYNKLMEIRKKFPDLWPEASK